MNRLVIIGNGFDLAHGLPTSYRDFIDDLWCKISKSPEDYSDLVLINNERYNFLEGAEINTFKDFKKCLDVYAKNRIGNHGFIGWSKGNFYLENFGKPKVYLFQFENYFFKTICDKSHIINWVDIENEYYELLKECLKTSDNSGIKALNEQFESIKNKLSDYLCQEVESKYDFSNLRGNSIYQIFRVNQYEDYSLNEFRAEFSKKDQNHFTNLLEEEGLNINAKKVYEDKREMSVKNYFLSFNYTPTISEYVYSLNYNLNQLNEIHGRLKNTKNKINFGFGDEMDKHYQEIEEKNENEYLKNIKSFQYLNTSNYKDFLDLIDSEFFQVYIMGHSCGLSDRILLNTIFEHNNCRSIKVFYHEWEDLETNEIKDNYTEITQNISRHFNKKKLMREKIVNKTLCQALPQIQLPKKE